MMRDTGAIAIPGPSAPQTAAVSLSAPRTLLQQPEQPDQPLQHRLPADDSGLAATIELYDLIIASASSSAASASSSSSATASADPSSSSGAAISRYKSETFCSRAEGKGQALCVCVCLGGRDL